MTTLRLRPIAVQLWRHGVRAACRPSMPCPRRRRRSALAGAKNALNLEVLSYVGPSSCLGWRADFCGIRLCTAAVGELVRCTDGAWMVRPPRHCPRGGLTPLRRNFSYWQVVHYSIPASYL